MFCPKALPEGCGKHPSGPAGRAEGPFQFVAQALGSLPSPDVRWQEGCAPINRNEHFAKGKGNKWKQDTKREETREKKKTQRSETGYGKAEYKLAFERREVWKQRTWEKVKY